MPFEEPTATMIDGVAVWSTDVPGPCMGGLVFRTGKADETLRASGLNHIVEHLALFPLASSRLDMNGSVNTLTTSFVVNGTQAEVESFLSAVCRNLGSLPLERLELERRVLETEARSRGGTFAGSASARFGARGFGVADWTELGLRHLGVDEVAAWAAERFTSRQAAAWMTRPPTAALRFELAEGERLPVPVPDPIPGLVVPSHIHSWGNMIGCSFAAKRSMPLYVATRILHARAMDTMRTERALSYSVGQAEERIGPFESLYFLTCDMAEDRAPQAIDVFTSLMEEVAAGHITDEEVERAHRAAMPWNATDPSRPAREAWRKATASLFGREPTDWKALASQGERLTPAKVAARLEEALSTAILVAPEGLDVPERFARHPAPVVVPHRVEGRLFVRWDSNRREENLLGAEGITRVIGGTMTTMRFDQIEVGTLGPDGTITLIDRAGDSMVVEPNQLMRGNELASTIQERLSDRMIDLRQDVVGWFELQSLVESHDVGAISTMWREIEILANVREPHERILALAFGVLGQARGIVTVTDRRLLHISAGRKPPISYIDRSEVVSVQTTSGLLGAKLRIVKKDRRFVVVDRIRPRANAAELELLLAPIEDRPDQKVPETE